MSHIFYLFGIIYLIREFMDLISPIEFTRRMEYMHSIASTLKTEPIEFSQYTQKTKNIIMEGLFNALVILWAGIGLFTANWLIFVAFLIFIFLIYTPINNIVKKVFGFGKAYTTLHIFGTIVDILLIGFAIINQYHFKIDLFKLLFN